MSNEIVRLELPESIAKELRVDADGKGFISRRGLAKLCGVQHKSIQVLLSKIEVANKPLPKVLQPFAGQGFEGGEQLSDTIATAIIQYYAFGGNEKAQETLLILSAIGLRSYIQLALDWKPPVRKSLTPEEIVELCCLPVPTEWQRRFPEEYYGQLSRLTGLNTFGNARPTRWAQLTKQLVYDWLPSGVYTQIKRCKAETGSWDKLHQFLSEDGLRLLEQHHQTLLTLMTASRSLDQLMELLHQSCSGQYQLGLFEKPSRKAIAKK